MPLERVAWPGTTGRSAIGSAAGRVNPGRGLIGSLGWSGIYIGQTVAQWAGVVSSRPWGL
jgi:hypothetical protein